MVRSWLVIAILASLVTTAHADACPEGSSDGGMHWIEVFVKDKTKEPSGTAWVCVEDDAQRLAKRIIAACGKILDRDGDKSPCTDLVANAGLTKIGNHDIFAIVAAYPDDPLNSDDTWGRRTLFNMFRAMRDPRGLALIIERWRAAIPRVEKLKKGSSRFGEWSTWRQLAAPVIGELGGEPERSFLDEQAKATKDTHVADACRAAIAAIEKRLAKAAPP